MHSTFWNLPLRTKQSLSPLEVSLSPLEVVFILSINSKVHNGNFINAGKNILHIKRTLCWLLLSKATVKCRGHILTWLDDRPTVFLPSFIKRLDMFSASSFISTGLIDMTLSLVWLLYCWFPGVFSSHTGVFGVGWGMIWGEVVKLGLREERRICIVVLLLHSV